MKNEAAGRIRFFSDEKIFTVDAKINRRNDRWLAHDPENVVSKIKFPANVHVLGVVSSEGDVMPPHFFKKGETVTKEVYVHILTSVVKPWDEDCGVRKVICFSAGRCAGSHKPFGPKLALRQSRYVLVQGILAS